MHLCQLKANTNEEKQISNSDKKHFFFARFKANYVSVCISSYVKKKQFLNFFSSKRNSGDRLLRLHFCSLRSLNIRKSYEKFEKFCNQKLLQSNKMLNR